MGLGGLEVLWRCVKFDQRDWSVQRDWFDQRDQSVQRDWSVQRGLFDQRDWSDQRGWYPDVEVGHLAVPEPWLL